MDRTPAGREVVTKHLFVTGGVASSLGKGLTASSLGSLLKARGLRVTMLKLDPETRDIPVLTYTTEYEGQDFEAAVRLTFDQAYAGTEIEFDMTVAEPDACTRTVEDS